MYQEPLTQRQSAVRRRPKPSRSCQPGLLRQPILPRQPMTTYSVSKRHTNIIAASSGLTPYSLTKTRSSPTQNNKNINITVNTANVYQTSTMCYNMHMRMAKTLFTHALLCLGAMVLVGLISLPALLSHPNGPRNLRSE